MSVQRLDPAMAGRYEGFLQDGSTTKQEILGRLGLPSSSYDNEKVLIYRVALDEDGRMNMFSGGGTCHACVLVFSDDGLLERHSLVKHGCRQEEE